ncbi:hypothetical protein C6P97_29195 [Burkholderia multivorans]|uniref:Secreted protein n=1 Tax=Burkholderia multivorans TaxID=87883 RepID=A0AB37ARJ5_9BURK|nr:hypothetical protein C6P97_29195 [Burkholderia multivorans]PRE44781.1 hypothetical protein C6P99_20670 [Burkholderia multivorans]
MFHRALLSWAGRALTRSARIATIGRRLYQYKSSSYSGIRYTRLIVAALLSDARRASCVARRTRRPLHGARCTPPLFSFPA